MDREQSEIMKCLGLIIGKLDSMEKAQTRVTLALIGIIAAQIGVKILGTDPLLDIATTLALVGIVIIAGGIWVMLKVSRHGESLTASGKAFGVLLMWMAALQVSVYLRDLGLISPRVIYLIRIFQGISFITFGWLFIQNHHLFKDSSASDRK